MVTALVQAAATPTTSATRAGDPGAQPLLHRPQADRQGLQLLALQFEANTAMKMKAIANYIKKQPDIKKVTC